MSFVFRTPKHNPILNAVFFSYKVKNNNNIFTSVKSMQDISLKTTKKKFKKKIHKNDK